MSVHTSHQTFAKSGVKLLVLFGLAVGLAACGQRGPLVAPTTNTNVQTDVADPQGDQSDLTPDDGTTPTKAPDDSFVLDPLL